MRFDSQQPNNLGIYPSGMAKGDLFKTVILDGDLPRKTFSIGKSREKRFYMEARKIQYSVPSKQGGFLLITKILINIPAKYFLNIYRIYAISVQICQMLSVRRPADRKHRLFCGDF